jgi:hypothetical protein
MRQGIPGAPWWAVDADFPDPGVVEFTRPVGMVACIEAQEEVSLKLVQREEDGCLSPVQMSVHGMRLSADEADLLIRLMRAGYLVMTTESPDAAPGDTGDQEQVQLTA